MNPATAVSQQSVRDQFPALAGGFAFFENAGGSQVPRQVIDRVNRFFVEAYAQTGAGYPAADLATETAKKAKDYANVLMNGEGVGHTLIGPSTTALLHRLADAIAPTFKPGDEVVVSVANHEANIGPWTKLERQGAKILRWGVDRDTGEYSYRDLEGLLSERTRVVAVAHTSNLLGDVMDVARVSRLAHAVGAQTVVDGVAFAAHGAVDVKALDADFYAFSFYKVYGPHVAALYGRTEAWAGIVGPNHYFIPDHDFPWKFELGCQPYEALAGILGIADYFSFLAGMDEPSSDRRTVEAAYAAIQAFEAPVQQAIADYLLSKPQIRVVGPRTASIQARKPTFSFLHREQSSEHIVTKVNGPSLGIRYGHMYAARLCEALGAPQDTGFVRISAVHYNTTNEVDLLLDALEEAL